MENMQEEKITLEQAIPVETIFCIARDALMRWYLIVTVALIAAMAAYVYADVAYTPQYTTNTTFVVTSGSTFTTAYQNLSATKGNAEVFSQLLNSSLLRQKIAEETGISNFGGTISASVVPETNLLNVTVQGGSARTVYLVTRSMIDNYSLVSREVLGDTVMEVLREPEVPVAPSNSKGTVPLMCRTALTAGIAVLAMLVLQAAMHDKVRSRADADKKLTCRVLGELYHERKRRKLGSLLRGRKSGILITNPLTSSIYSESIHKLSGRIDKLRRKGERVVMVTSLLENEGKSTVAVNLALSWAAKGRRVLLLDCDLRKPACHRILELPESGGMLKLLQGEGALADHVVKPAGSALHVVTGGKAVRNASTYVTSPVMAEVLRQAAAEYDLVIVDTPPMGLTPDAECIAEFAHCAVLVARQNTAGTEDLNHTIGLLEKTDTHMLGCVLNNVRGMGGFAPAYHGYGYGKYGRYKKYGYYKYGYGYGYGYGKKRASGSGEKGAV